jgi:hypothetical protein
MDQSLPPELYTVFHDPKPAKPTAIYTEDDLSTFLPEEIGPAGQVWALDPGKVMYVLRQFHPSVSMHVRARGRRAGPDGAFGVLRAVSADRLDIACRIHAEFDLTPPAARRYAKPPTLWYTPAYLAGRLLVNRKTGVVEYFRIGLPTDKTLNVHLTVTMPPQGEQHDIVRVECMELEGGDRKALEEPKWDESIDLALANARLAHQFYKFNDIAWTPTYMALAVARERRKPIMALVTWGSLDDQSC